MLCSICHNDKTYEQPIKPSASLIAFVPLVLLAVILEPIYDHYSNSGYATRTFYGIATTLPLWLLLFPACTIWLVKKRSTNIPRTKYTVNADVSLLAKCFNLVMWPIFRFQLTKNFKPLDLDDMKRDAIQKENVGTDFGDAEYEKVFQTFITLINKNRTRWTPLGYAAFRSMFLRLLAKRLRFFNYIKDTKVKHYIENNRVCEPIFVFGMPRTGTTFLHRLLNLDPSARSPLMYELLDPIERVPGDFEKDVAEKVKYFDSQAKFSMSMVPQLKTMHDWNAYDAEECTQASFDKPRTVLTYQMLLEYTQNSSELETFGELFYRYYQKQLQILAYNALKFDKTELAKKRWVLKCPGHLASLDALVKEFPDAKLIWNHRDLNQSIASLCSLYRLGQDLTRPVCDLKEMGKVVMRFAEANLTRGDKFLEVDHAQNPCCHVKYNDLIENPINVVKTVYKELGYEFTPEYETILEEYIQTDKAKRAAIKKQQGGKEMHHYSLEQFALTEGDIDDKFSWYTQKYL